MVRKASSRCVRLAFVALLAGCATPPLAAQQDLCPTLTIPASLGLACAPTEDLAPGAVTVAPTEGSFAALSRLSLRPLERTGEDALAWSNPTAWLQRQITLDTSGASTRLECLGQDPDSPFAGPEAEGALRSLENMLSGMARLPLNACNEPAETSPNRWTMDCRFTAGGIGLLLQHRLVAQGDRRWAITSRAANEQRLRHFEAIANSFSPPP